MSELATTIVRSSAALKQSQADRAPRDAAPEEERDTE